MPVWDPEAYLAFADYRARPFQDLVARVEALLDPAPSTIVDLGCGPGQLSRVLRAQWPATSIVGIDSSPEMVARAEADNADPRTSYRVGDVSEWRPDEPVDLIISNATFQWVPTQRDLLPRLREHLTPDGLLAFSVPHNYTAPSHALLHQLAAREPYAEHLNGIPRDRGVSAADYLELLATDGWQVDAWTTTYLHVLPGTDPVFRWIGGTGARPFVQALPTEELRDRFSVELAEALRAGYPEQPHGTVLPFERVFVVTHRAPRGSPARH